uniref:uncharacterized protein LOC120339200 n=1 Tax=Styela clava TaxID=7725 RepID=UPI001939E254|nr:uncharacterized protein LOC120339200 [Styela clava]
MPRKYQRISNRGSWSESDMRMAVEAVQKGEGLKSAARTHSVPRTTLRRHVFSLVKKMVASKHLGPSSIFPRNTEENLVKHILDFERRGFPLTVKDIRQLACEFAIRNGIKNNFSKSLEMAGKDWWADFRTRHNDIITIRKPQPLSIQRAIHLNKPIVQRYFDMLESVMNDLCLFDQPSKIYNVDETGLSLVPGVKNIVGEKGSKSSSQITAGERGLSQTIVVCVNAIGDYIPPMVIYKGKRVNPALDRGLPAGSIVKYSESGYINKDLFLAWMEHCCTSKRSDCGKTLLVVDGHHSHTHSLEVLEYARSHNVEIVSMPPHTSHYLLLLDKVHFKPLKDHFKEAVRVHHRNNPEAEISRIDFPALFSKAYYKIATVGNAVTSFRATGLYPLDIEQIPEHAFAPSQTTAIVRSGESDNITNRDYDVPSHEVTTTTEVESVTGEPCCYLPNLSRTSSGVQLASEKVRDSLRQENSREPDSTSLSDESFEDILPLPVATQRAKKQRKKAIQTGIRVLTSEKYVSSCRNNAI